MLKFYALMGWDSLEALTLLSIIIGKFLSFNTNKLLRWEKWKKFLSRLLEVQ